METGEFVASPEVEVVGEGNGLRGVQDGTETQKHRLGTREGVVRGDA